MLRYSETVARQLLKGRHLTQERYLPEFIRLTTGGRNDERIHDTTRSRRGDYSVANSAGWTAGVQLVEAR